MRDRRAFTLLEAVVALAVVGTSAVAVLSAASADLRFAERGRRALEAEALGEERLAAVTFAAALGAAFLPESLAQGRFAEPFAAYWWNASTSAVDGEPGLSEVAVRVSWDGGEYALRTRLVVRLTGDEVSAP
jgi:type II secretory pathway pseudopilin PulG